MSRNLCCDFLADPDSRSFSRVYTTNIGRSRYTHNITTLREATWPLLTGFAKKWRCWLVRTPSVGAPDGYLLVDRDDSWGEQNQGGLPNLINPTQPQAWLIRLFEFLPQVRDDTFCAISNLMYKMHFTMTGSGQT